MYIYNCGMLGYAVSGFIAGKVVEVGGPQLALAVAALMSAVGGSMCTLAVYQVSGDLLCCLFNLFQCCWTENFYALGLFYHRMVFIQTFNITFQ